MVVKVVKKHMVSRDPYGVNVVLGNKGIPLVPDEEYQPYYKYVYGIENLSLDNEYIINIMQDDEYSKILSHSKNILKKDILVTFSKLTLKDRANIIGCEESVVDEQIKVYEELYKMVSKETITERETYILTGHANLSNVDLETYKEIVKGKASYMKNEMSLRYITLELKKRIIDRLIEDGYTGNKYKLIKLLENEYNDEYTGMVIEFKNNNIRMLTIQELKG